ncbi:hypothetical protein ACF0H5_015643 [Mactra antiquata]
MCGKTDSIKSNLSHIGIGHLTNWTTRICYCFVGYQFTSQPPSMCTHYIPNLSTYKKNKNHTDILSVYRIHERSWTSGTTSSFYACLIAKLETTNENIIHEELPCYAKPKSHDIGGIVCASISGELSDKLACTIEKHGRYHYCYVARSFTLPSARSYCFNISGDLLPYFREEIKELFPNITNSFWTGSFRAFKVTDHADTKHVESESCLAVTRIGTRLYLDPDDCSSYKQFICSDDVLITKSATTPVRETVDEKDTSDHGRYSTTTIDQERTSEHGRYSTTSVDQEDTSDHGRYSTTTVDKERTSEHVRYSTTTVDKENTSEHGQYSTKTVDQERTSEHGQYSTTTVDKEYTQKTDKETNTKVAQEEFNTEYLIYVYTGSCILLLIITSGIIVNCYRKRKLSQSRTNNSEGNNETPGSCTNQTDQSPLAVTIQLNNVDINDANASSHLYCEPIMIESVSKSSDDYDHVCLKESSKKTFLMLFVVFWV